MKINRLFSSDMKIPDAVKGEPDYGGSPETAIRKSVW
jgi:hypothetical protein